MLHHHLFRFSFVLTSDPNRHLWSISLSSLNVLHLSQRQQPIHHLPKNHMFPIQKLARLQRNEKLTPICPWPTVRHAQQPRCIMPQRKVFIFKLVSIDAYATCAICVEKVASLNHKVFNDSVKYGTFVAEGGVLRAERASAEGAKVFGCTGDYVGEEFEF